VGIGKEHPFNIEIVGGGPSPLGESAQFSTPGGKWKVNLVKVQTNILDVLELGEGTKDQMDS